MREDHGPPEHVEFEGVTYTRWPQSRYKHMRRYFSPGLIDGVVYGKDHLHREVWKSAHGPIPAGHVIHHIDGDPGNNDLTNLACVTVSEHGKIHSGDPGRLEQLQALAEIGRQFAPEWHRSAEGRRWHEANGRKQWETREPAEITCGECGCTALRHFTTRNSVRYCSRRCARRAADRERRYEHQVECPECGETFWQSKYRAKPRFCSRSCGATHRWRRHRTEQPA